MAPQLKKHYRSQNYSLSMGHTTGDDGTPVREVGGPLVNEFLVDVYSCIEDQRLSFHAYNQDKYRCSLHHASAMARVPRPRRDKAVPVDRIIVP